jgi:cell wall-associated NlpC family hydrolase
VNPAAVIATFAAAALSPVLGIAILFGGGGAPADDSAMPLCATTGPVPALDPAQAANARAIVAAVQQVEVNDQQAAHQAAIISLITAFQESRMRDLANPSVPGSALQPGAEGSGTDHDSIGLFQQRGNWGTVAQRMDPAHATRSFVQRLLTVDGWDGLPPGVAAQAVQISAYPDRYARWLPAASAWLTTISGPGPATCGGSGLDVTGSRTLPHGFALPAGTSPAAATAVTFALAQLGKPYVYGAAGPNAYDCSGLTMAAWATAGVPLPHYTVTQASAGTATGAAELQPGDLVFIPGSDGTMDAPGHVGMYVGRELVVEAPQTGDVVKLVPLSSFQPVAAIRHIS